MYKNNKNILINLYRHNSRLKNNYSNKNIDISKADNNYFIKKANKTFYMSVKKAIESKDIVEIFFKILFINYLLFRFMIVATTIIITTERYISISCFV